MVYLLMEELSEWRVTWDQFLVFEEANWNCSIIYHTWSYYLSTIATVFLFYLFSEPYTIILWLLLNYFCLVFKVYITNETRTTLLTLSLSLKMEKSWMFIPWFCSREDQNSSKICFPMNLGECFIIFTHSIRGGCIILLS